MKLTSKIILVSMLLAAITPAISFSQSITTSDYNSFSLGVKGGITHFYGDVMQYKYASDNPYKKTKYCGVLEFTKDFNNIFGVRLGAMMLGLDGSSQNLNLHFLTTMNQYSCEGVINLNDLISFYPRKEKIVNVYLFAGFGLMTFRSKLYSYDENNLIATIGYDTSRQNKKAARKEWVYPFGLGVKFKADSRFDFGIEFTMNLTNTDKLDAWMVAKSYMDRYSYTTLSITYKIGGKDEHVAWVNPFMDTSKTSVTTAQSTIVTNNNSIKSNVTENNTKSKTSVTPAPIDKFYISSGIFSSKKQAKQEADKLKNDGYNEAEIINQPATGNWLVVYKTFQNADDAKTELSTIRKVNADAKLYEKKNENDYSEIYVPAPVIQDTTKVVVKTTTPPVNQVTNQNSVTSNTVKQNPDTSNSKQIVKTSTTSVNTIVTNNTTTTTTTSITPTKPTTTTTTPTITIAKKFFIIAGSFPTEQMANTEVDALKTKGYPDAEVVGKNDAGNWRICFKAYATREDANKDMPVIKAKNPSAWIFEKK